MQVCGSLTHLLLSSIFEELDAVLACDDTAVRGRDISMTVAACVCVIVRIVLSYSRLRTIKESRGITGCRQLQRLHGCASL
jgi:hypothetical protein